jgi:RNA polymerase sigma-70 factor (ECF subfamily)
MYEEKSQEVVAAQMGMSENALRQLIFRARASFKKALVGEAEIQGKSMSQILSIAARKAAAESGKYISAAGAFLLVLAISIGILPNLGQAPVSEVAEAPQTQSQTQQNSQGSNDSSATDSEASDSTAESAVESEPAAESQAGATETVAADTVSTDTVSTDTVSTDTESETLVLAQPALVIDPAPQAVEPTPTPTQLPTLDDSDFEQILNTEVSQAGFYTSSKAAAFADFFQGESIEIFGGTGVSAFVYLNPQNLTIENAMFQMWVDSNRYYAIARTSSVANDGLTLTYQGSNFYVVDDQGRVFDNSPLANASAKVELQVDINGKPLKASIKLSK